MTDVIGKVCLSHKKVKIHIKKEFVRRHPEFAKRVARFVLLSCVKVVPEGDKMLYGELRLCDGKPTLDFFAERDIDYIRTFSMEASK